MTWVELLLWSITAWWIWFWVQRARSVWSLHPENPGRIYIAEFVGVFIISIVCLLFYPSITRVYDIDENVITRMLTLPVGIGSITHGDLVSFKSATSGRNIIQRVVALPSDVLSTSNGAILVNGVVVGASSDSFPPLATECLTATIPVDRIAVMNWAGTEAIECKDIGTVPKEALVDRCIVVLWPFSESCHSRANPIPAPTSN